VPNSLLELFCSGTLCWVTGCFRVCQSMLL